MCREFQECKRQARETWYSMQAQVSVDEPLSLRGVTQPRLVCVVRRPRLCEHDNGGATVPNFVFCERNAYSADLP